MASKPKKEEKTEKEVEVINQMKSLTQIYYQKLWKITSIVWDTSLNFGISISYRQFVFTIFHIHYRNVNGVFGVKSYKIVINRMNFAKIYSKF